MILIIVIIIIIMLVIVVVVVVIIIQQDVLGHEKRGGERRHQRGHQKIWSISGGCTVSEKKKETRTFTYARVFELQNVIEMSCLRGRKPERLRTHACLSYRM